MVQFSVQRRHVHLLVEAKDRMALARGMQAFVSPPRSTSTQFSSGLMGASAVAACSPTAITR